MSLAVGTRINRGYATVVDNDGDNYRDIALVMTQLGMPMNHSSARNHVLRVMTKFARAFAEAFGFASDDESVSAMARSPSFQAGISDLLQIIEHQRRASDSD